MKACRRMADGYELVSNMDLIGYRNRQWKTRAYYALPTLCERLIRLLTIHIFLND